VSADPNGRICRRAARRITKLITIAIETEGGCEHMPMDPILCGECKEAIYRRAILGVLVQEQRRQREGR
jgi:hypothetical protein